MTDGRVDRVDRIDPIAPVPPYRQIADIIRRRITSGKYPPDMRIPTESEMVEEFEVARTTAGISVMWRAARSLWSLAGD